MESRKFAIVVLLAGTVAACGGETFRWTGTITDSAGVTIVSNPAHGIWTEADRWTVEEELRIGVQEGDPEYQFGQVLGVTTDSRGRIFVLDGQAKQVRVFSPEGTYEQTVGGPGDGPGELANPGFDPVMSAGDTLVVHDRRGRRVNLYAPDGSSAGSYRVPQQERLTWRYKATRSGVIAEQVVSSPRAEAENPMDAIVIRGTDGTITDTLMRFPSSQRIAFSEETRFVVTVYHPEPAWALTDDMELLFGVNDEYRIRIYSSAGVLERIITKPWERRPVTDRDTDVLTNLVTAGWIREGAPPEMIQQVLNRWRFHDFLPAFQTLESGPAGTVWVQHVQPPSEMSEGEVSSLNLWWNEDEASAPEWDVFDSEGHYLGVVTMPRMFTPKMFRGDKIYGVWRDEFDVQYVVRLRIVGDLGVEAT